MTELGKFRNAFVLRRSIFVAHAHTAQTQTDPCSPPSSSSPPHPNIMRLVTREVTRVTARKSEVQSFLNKSRRVTESKAKLETGQGSFFMR